MPNKKIQDAPGFTMDEALEIAIDSGLTLSMPTGKVIPRIRLGENILVKKVAAYNGFAYVMYKDVAAHIPEYRPAQPIAWKSTRGVVTKGKVGLKIVRHSESVEIIRTRNRALLAEYAAKHEEMEGRRRAKYPNAIEA